LEGWILRHDPTLDGPGPTITSPAQAAPAGAASGYRGRPVRFGLATVLVVMLVIAGPENVIELSCGLDVGDPADVDPSCLLDRDRKFPAPDLRVVTDLPAAARAYGRHTPQADKELEMSFINRAYAKFDAAMQRRTGIDLRLLYGFGVPIVVTALLVTLGIALAPSTVTVVALMMIEVVMLVTVVIGLTRMLSEPGDVVDHSD